jgi:hypothetical protein
MRPSTAVAGQVKSQNAWAKVFGSVILEIKKKTQVPVLLPSELDFPIGEGTCASGSGDASGYWVSLDVTCPGGANAGFLAGFEGTLKHDPYSYARLAEDKELKRVRLARGIQGFFSPVGCGGSCGPAIIIWREKGVWYDVALHMSSAPQSAQEEREQEESVMAVANSAILAEPR